MAAKEPRYFVCSLGQAAEWNKNHPKPYHTINELIDFQAETSAQSPAIGFADHSTNCHHISSNGNETVMTFKQLRLLSINASKMLARTIAAGDFHETTTVALMCTSSMQLLLTWLGLIRLDISVVLLAPQLELSAVEHLCSVCDAHFVFCDNSNAPKLRGLASTFCRVEIDTIGRYEEDPTDLSTIHTEKAQPQDTAYVFHTSGTSSGRPKPIPQSHHAAVGVLPNFSNQGATFSTTPLYHGGIADCFRAWSSGAMIWLFPEGVMPITAANILRSIRYADDKQTVKYFTSVPYILQMIAEDPPCLSRLREMQMVGVGGAALPKSTGDRLVDQGIRLVSRYGSAECGFLMSSHRSFDTDKNWNFLRPYESSSFFRFEKRHDDLSELIILPHWPHLSKTNREDGSYATSDLFEPHGTIENCWKYHSRLDSQITLLNGKKFDPSPIEDSVVSQVECLRDMMIFGSDKAYPGALLFPVDSNLKEEDVVKEVWNVLIELNQDTQKHARISREALAVMKLDQSEEYLPKSSKGTILRSRAEQIYQAQIKAVYRGKSGAKEVRTTNEMLVATSKIFDKVMGKHIDVDQDVYQQGVDSIACAQIRGTLTATFDDSDNHDMPLNIIYDHGTIRLLAEYLLQRENGYLRASNTLDELNTMKKLAEEFGNLEQVQAVELQPSNAAETAVVLTGATGMLGAHILDLLRQDGDFSRVYCLLRGSSPLAAHERVSKALVARGLAGLPPYEQPEITRSKVVCMTCKLDEESLGLSPEDLMTIKSDVALIVHSAWTVNFNLGLASFTDHIAGTRNLINLALETGCRFSFVSSTAAVTSSTASIIPETISSDPRSASSLGYSRSKWVAEQLCVKAHEAIMHCKVDRSQYRLPHVSIIRVGQLCGNRKGIWNLSEAYPLILSSAQTAKCLPLLNEPLSWLPVDRAAKAILEVAENKETQQHLHTPHVFHVLNPHLKPSWRDLLSQVKSIEDTQYNPNFEIVPPSKWLENLSSDLTFEKDNVLQQRLKALLPLWKRTYGSIKGDKNDHDRSSSTKFPIFDVKASSKVSDTMRNVQPLEKQDIIDMWKWIHQSGQTRSHSRPD